MALSWPFLDCERASKQAGPWPVSLVLPQQHRRQPHLHKAHHSPSYCYYIKKPSISLSALNIIPHLLRYSYLFKRCHLPHNSMRSATTLGQSSTIASLAIRAQRNSPASLPSIVGSRCWRSRATISQLKDSRISSRLWQETPLFGNSSSNTTIQERASTTTGKISSHP